MNIKKQNSYISKIIFGAWVSIVLVTMWLMREELTKTINLDVRYIRLLELIVCLLIIGESLIFKYMCKKLSDSHKAVIIFAIAFFVRILLLPFSKYIPTNDFQKYLLGACHFVTYGYEGGMYSGLLKHGIPSFAGQAIINGTLLKIFSPTLLGMQFLNCFYTAGICMMIFLIGKRIDTKAAITGAILYTFYPMSILSTQITTNHHGAGFFMLLAIYLYFKALEKKGLKICILLGSAACLVISNYYHPSIVIVLCAFVVYAFVYCVEVAIDKIRNKKNSIIKCCEKRKSVIAKTLVIIVMYTIIWQGSMGVITASGYIPEMETITSLSKLAVGFNFDTRGTYSEDYVYISSFPEEEQAKVAVDLAISRIKEHGAQETINLMLEKNQKAWFGADNYFNFYQFGIRDKLAEMIENTTDSVLKTQYEEELQSTIYFMADVMITDNVFVILIWGLALIGIVRILFRFDAGNVIYLLMYIPLGWMAFIMITELQTRYRYLSMPILILLAGFGVEAMKELCEKIRCILVRNINVTTKRDSE